VADLILALDQGTTSTRAILFRGPDLTPLALARRELTQSYPRPGWVEHDPEEIFRHSVEVTREAIAMAGVRTSDVAAIGIASQRETTIVWERATGAAIYPAIVWQDRRTADTCARLRDGGHEAEVSRRTGLLLDPYFSATKLTWILDHVPGARERAAHGELAFGTVDTFLLWRLTEGNAFATDATNASRTALYNISCGAWDDDLLRLFGVPAAMLPEVHDTAGVFGRTNVLGTETPIAGIAGDQQAALIGQACFRPGMVKATYGTGAFVLLTTGAKPVASRHRLLTTVAWQRGGRRTYALEGAIFVAGASVQWLRDGLGLLRDAAEADALAAAADPAQRVVLVPAFTGLGAPWWNAEARGAILGLTRATGRAEIVRAALEAVAFQTRDLIEAMHADWGEASETVLRVDGGMTASAWTMQAIADQIAAPVDRPAIAETTALGAAYLAGWAVGVCPGPDEFTTTWRLERRFSPAAGEVERAARYNAWRGAVASVVSG
jgi:glycerol kinase